MKKIYFKKNRGTDIIADILVMITASSLVFFFLLFSSSTQKDTIDIKSMNSIARNYIIQMEIDGYLKPENEVIMIEELSKLGLNEIDLSGTTLSKVDYGNFVYLNIKGKIDRTIYTLTDDGFKITKENIQQPITKIRASTGTS